jgi:filamentous hemagglutinin family protein
MLKCDRIPNPQDNHRQDPQNFIKAKTFLLARYIAPDGQVLSPPHPQFLRVLFPLTLSLICATPAVAQLIPDSTLGAESSVVTPLDALGDQIDGGAVRGSNLFHSFQDFNIDDGRGAFFSNPTGIENILTRVTGGNPSNIFGTLGVLGDANLFLINPNGIVFGPNARLDVGGSFFASTAEGITFLDGYQFSATNPDVPPLLTINVPIGLQFSANPGGIVNRSVATNDAGEVRGLEVPLGRTLGLVGGDIALEGGWLTAESGRVELGSVGGNSTVSLTPVDVGFALGYEGVENYQNIQLLQQALVNTSGKRGGDVRVRANRLLMQDGGAILAETLGAGRAGILTIDATESVRLSGTYPDGSLVTGLSVQTRGSGDGGELTINTRQLSIRDGAAIFADTASEGQAGMLMINATESFELSGTATNSEKVSALNASTFGLGDAGKIDIFTGRLLIEDGAGIYLNSLNREVGGNAGTLNINATGSVEILGITPDGNLGTEVSAATLGSGNGGEINITTGRLLIEGGGNLFLSTRNAGAGGRGGTLNVNASESVQLMGTSPDGSLSSGIFANTEGLGDAGTINITTGQLLLQDGANIFLDSRNEEAGGRAGTFVVNATESVQLIGRSPNGSFISGVFTNTEGLGDAGTIDITTERLLLQNGAAMFLASMNEGEGGRGGTLTVDASESVEFIGTTSDGTSGNVVFAASQGSGNGGSVTINTGWLHLQDGASIVIAASGEGTGGTLTIRATESVELIGSAALPFSPNTIPTPTTLNANTFGSGDGGRIDISTRWLSIQDGAQIVTNGGQGKGGQISINATESVELIGSGNVPLISDPELGSILPSSNLTAGTFGVGDAGEITIDTGRLVVRDGAVILLNSLNEEAGGRAGTLTVNATESIELIGRDATNSAGGLFSGTNGLGDAGTININTGRFLLRDGASISLNSLNEGAGGRGGALTINATESVELSGTNLDGTEGSSVFAATSGLGDGGSVTINTGQLLLQDGAQIFLLSSNREAGGRGGTLTVNARESVEVVGTTAVPQTSENELIETRISSTSGVERSGFIAGTWGRGQGGEILINTQRFSARDGADISVSTIGSGSGSGSGGTLTINASEFVEVVGVAAIPTEVTTDTESEAGVLTESFNASTILSAFSLGAGNAGEVQIHTERLSVRDGGSISVLAEGDGQGGRLIVNASESVELIGNSENTSSNLRAVTLRGGNAGQIEIFTERLSLRDGADIATSSWGTGAGGTVRVEASESVELIGTTPDGFPSRLFASARGNGNGGNVTVETGQLRIADRAAIAVNSRVPTPEELSYFNIANPEIVGNLGNPGSIDITADDIRLENGGLLDAISSTGRGGNIDVRTRNIQLRQGIITASGRGNDPTFDGNIDIDTETLVLLDNSQIITSSTDPQGGSNITFRPIDGDNGALVLLQSPDSLINAQGELSVDGEIEPDPAKAPDPVVLDAESQLSRGCQDYAGSEFYVTGRGGIPPSPYDPLGGSSPIEIDWVEAPDSPEVEEPESRDIPSPVNRPLIEAQGWVVAADGTIVLTAQPHRGTPTPPALSHPDCQHINLNAQ